MNKKGIHLRVQMQFRCKTGSRYRKRIKGNFLVPDNIHLMSYAVISDYMKQFILNIKNIISVHIPNMKFIFVDII